MSQLADLSTLLLASATGIVGMDHRGRVEGCARRLKAACQVAPQLDACGVTEHVVAAVHHLCCSTSATNGLEQLAAIESLLSTVDEIVSPHLLSHRLKSMDTYLSSLGLQRISAYRYTPGDCMFDSMSFLLDRVGVRINPKAHTSHMGIHTK